MAQVIYATFGQEPQNPVNQTAACNKCEPTFALAPVGGLFYQTEADARITAQNPVLRRALFDVCVPQLWLALWNGFQCTNGQCRTKKACGQRPTFLAMGAWTRPEPAPAGPLVWQIMVGMAREIQCVAGAAVPDVVPDVPVVEALETPVFLSMGPVPPQRPAASAFLASAKPIARGLDVSLTPAALASAARIKAAKRGNPRKR